MTQPREAAPMSTGPRLHVFAERITGGRVRVTTREEQDFPTISRAVTHVTQNVQALRRSEIWTKLGGGILVASGLGAGIDGLVRRDTLALIGGLGSISGGLFALEKGMGRRQQKNHEEWKLRQIETLEETTEKFPGQ